MANDIKFINAINLPASLIVSSYGGGTESGDAINHRFSSFLNFNQLTTESVDLEVA